MTPENNENVFSAEVDAEVSDVLTAENSEIIEKAEEETKAEQPKPPLSSKFPPFLAKVMRPFDDMPHMWLALGFPILIMVLIYTALKVWPFGDNSVLVLDLNGQYVYYFEAIRDFFRGEQGIIYSFERALGGEFLGIVAYYLASPFSFIVALFPEGMITESLYLLLILKCGLSGMNMCIYLHKSHPTNHISELIFSVMYALTSYGVVMQHNTMWFDCVLFLPLILLGVESLVKYKKYKLFTITLALAVLSNYYIGYMVCIAVAAYFFFCYFSNTESERNPLGEDRHFLKSLGRIALFAIIAVGIACAMIIPAYYSLQFGKSDFTDPSFQLEQKFDFIDMISKMYPGSYDTVRPEGRPFVYSGLLTLIFIPLFFTSDKITTRKKVAYGLLSGFFVFSFAASTVDLVWHGFQKPNWLNYRYSFIFCFVIIVIAYLAFEHLEKFNMQKIYAVGISLGVLLLILQKLELDNVKDLTTVWISVFFIFLYMVLLSVCHKKQRGGNTASILLVVVLLELFANGLCDAVALNIDVRFSSRKGYKEFQDKWTPIADMVNENDDGFFRAEKTTHRKTNDNFLLNLNGLSNSTSTLNRKQITFLNQMGYSSKSHWSKYLGGTPVSDSLLGIKYLLADKLDDVNAIWGKAKYKDSDNRTVAYENAYAMSVGYTVSSDVINFEMEATSSPFERMNMLVGYMLGKNEPVQLFVPYSDPYIGTRNITVTEIAGHIKYAKTNKTMEADVTFTIDSVENGYEIFVYFPSDYSRDTQLYLNGEKYSEFYTNETFRIVSLGAHTEGEPLDLKMGLLKDEVYIKADVPYIYYLDEELFREIMPQLQTGNFIIEEHTDSTLKGTITATEDRNQMLLTIPYDKGWKAYVDGVETQTYEILGAVTALNLTPGTHTVELKYRPWSVYAAASISSASVLTLTAIIVADNVIKKKRQNAADRKAPTEQY